MALLVTSSVQIARFANALYGVKLGSVTNAAVLEDVKALGVTSAFNSYYTASFGSSTNDAVATTILANLGLAGNSAAQAYVVGQLNAAGSAKGAAVLSMLNAFANMTSDATFGAAATAWNTKVTDAIAYTAANAADVTTDYSAPVTSQTFTLTTDVNYVSGGAGNDTISGLVGVSGTFTLGDSINGGAGTDTLNLLVQSGGQSQLVSLTNVENVNARLLEAAPGSALALNAIDWAGVTTLSFDNSMDETAVRVSGITTSTTISVKNEVDVSVDFRALTSGTDAVSLTLTSAGSGGGTAASLASAGVADINIDLDAAGLIDTVNLNLAAGTNYATLEAGADVATLNISGAGNAYLSSDDLYTSINATGAAGNLDITLSGVVDVAVKGGAGNDTLRLGTTISNGDSFDGGAGTDTIALTVGAFNRTLTTTNVEKATVTFAENGGGTLSVSASDASTINLQPSAAGAAIAITDIISGATVNLQRAATASIDFRSGTTTSTINVGSAGTGFSADALTITDGGAITINSIAGSAGKSNGVSSISLDANAKSLAINTSGTEADLTVNNMAIGGISALTITSQGSAGFTLTSGISGTSLASVVVNAAGNNAGDVTLAAIQDSTGLNSVTLNASSGADIYGATFEFGNGASGTNASINLTANAGNGDQIGTASADQAGIAITTTGWATLNINANASASGNVHIGTIAMATGAATGTGAVNIINISATVDTNSVVRTEAIDLSGAWTGQQVNLSNVAVAQSGTFVFASGGINLGAIENSKVTIGTINVATAGLATIGTIIATAASGTDLINFGEITVAQSGAVSIGAIAATAGRVGAITVNLNGDVSTFTAAAVTASAIGAVTINIAADDDAHLAALAATAGTLGNVQVNVAASGSAVFASLGASSIGSIAVSGAGFASIGTITANRIGTVSQTGSGTFSIDLSGVSAAAEINLGGGTANSVISGKGNDVITLLGGMTAKSGNDTITYSTAVQGTDNIINFIAGARASGGDVIALGVTGMGLVGASAQGVALTADAVVDLFFVSAGTATMTAADSIIVLGTAYASTASMLAAIVDGGAQEIVLNATATTGATYTIAWTDGTDTYVSLLSVSGATGLSLTTGSITTLAQLSSVTPGALVAANFDFV